MIRKEKNNLESSKEGDHHFKVLFLVLGVLLSLWFWRLPLKVGAEENSSLDIEEKVKSLKEEVENLVRSSKDSSSDSELKYKRAFCGRVETRDDEKETLIVNTRKGKKTVFYNEETVFVGLERKKIRADEVAKGSFIVAMGEYLLQKPTELVAERVVIQEPPSLSSRRSFWGKVTDISQEEKVFSLLPAGHEAAVIEVPVSTRTIFKKKEEGKIGKVSFNTLKKNDHLVVVGRQEKDKLQLEALLVYVISSSTEETAN